MAFCENIILHDLSSNVMKNILKSSGYLTLSNGIFPKFYQGLKAKGFWQYGNIMASAIAILVYRL